jgi:hypothetical protein
MNRKPNIIVLCSDEVKKSEIEEILWGIEEEGLNFFLKFVPDTQVIKENYTSNSLEIGIGIRSDRTIKLNSRKYDKDFIFMHRLDEDKNTLRNLGNNSARLVKGLPLK